VEQYRVLMTLLPLARTPMDKKGGQAMQSYARDIERMLSEATPWLKKATRRRPKGAKPGEIVVLLGQDEIADDPLYKDAQIARE
jgi:hypothetical protein